MIKIFFLCLLAGFTLVSPLYAWHRTDRHGLQDIAIAPDGTIWGCEDDGSLVFSTNKGRSWHEIRARRFNRVAASSRYVLGCSQSTGRLWFSSNRGRHWERSEVSGIIDVVIGPNDTAFACGRDGTIWMAEAGDFYRWHRIDTYTIRGGFQSISFNGRGIFAVGVNGTLWYAPYHGGRDLRFIRTRATGIAYVSADVDGRVWACTNSGVVWVSRNNGRRWRQLEFELGSARLYEAGPNFHCAIDNRGILAIGDYHDIYRGRDRDFFDRDLPGDDYYDDNWDHDRDYRDRDYRDRYHRDRDGY